MEDSKENINVDIGAERVKELTNEGGIGNTGKISAPHKTLIMYKFSDSNSVHAPCVISVWALRKSCPNAL